MLNTEGRCIIVSDSQLVAFTLGEEEYAIDINFTQEIMRIPSLTKLPNTPPFLEGVFNLRGKVIPVFDLKKKFLMSQTERSIDSRLLILDLDGIQAGIIVDDVSEVMKIDKESIKNLDTEIVGLSKNSIEGVYIVEERIIIVLNVSKLKSEIFKFNLERESVL
jgi:purine-binding chemotaxis protein CheW